MEEWAGRLERESRRLLRALGADRVVAIEHVGSTSVPDIAGRPILDVLVGLRGPEPTVEQLAALARVGYRAPRRRASRLYVSRGTPRRVTVHFAEWGSPRWRRLIDFRDVLRADPDAARRYAELKRSLTGASPAAYAEGKRRFVERELQREAPGRR